MMTGDICALLPHTQTHKRRQQQQQQQPGTGYGEPRQPRMLGYGVRE